MSSQSGYQISSDIPRSKCQISACYWGVRLISFSMASSSTMPICSVHSSDAINMNPQSQTLSVLIRPQITKDLALIHIFMFSIFCTYICIGWESCLFITQQSLQTESFCCTLVICHCGDCFYAPCHYVGLPTHWEVSYKIPTNGKVYLLIMTSGIPIILPIVSNKICHSHPDFKTQHSSPTFQSLQVVRN